MLIAGYLAMDGFTSVFQEKQFKRTWSRDRERNANALLRAL